jgi:hypothetical protein
MHRPDEQWHVLRCRSWLHGRDVVWTWAALHGGSVSDDVSRERCSVRTGLHRSADRQCTLRGECGLHWRDGVRRRKCVQRRDVLGDMRVDVHDVWQRSHCLLRGYAGGSQQLRHVRYALRRGAGLSRGNVHANLPEW